MAILNFKKRNEFRNWLKKNHSKEKECFVVVKRGEPTKGTLSYLDAVEEALCFGWVDSVVRPYRGELSLQRFSPRKNKTDWTELNKARAVRLMKLGLMTKAGMDVFLMASPFDVDIEIEAAFADNMKAYKNFIKFPTLYQKVRIDTIQRYKSNREQFESRLKKLIEYSEKGEMYGKWDDDGKLSNK